MATLQEIITRFEELDSQLEQIIVDVLTDEKQHILDLNREQLYDGKNSEGIDLSPTYYEDPYFKSLEQAVGYSDWKDKITPNPRRTQGVANLFINGFFYKSIDVTINKDGLRFNSSFDDENEISNKYGGNIFGLDDENKEDLNETANPSMISKIRDFLKL